MNELKSKIIDELKKINSSYEWPKSDWTRGFRSGMIEAFYMIIEWIKKGEDKDGRS